MSDVMFYAFWVLVVVAVAVTVFSTYIAYLSGKQAHHQATMDAHRWGRPPEKD